MNRATVIVILFTGLLLTCPTVAAAESDPSRDAATDAVLSYLRKRFLKPSIDVNEADAPKAKSKPADRRITSTYFVKPFATPNAYHQYGRNIDRLLQQAQSLYLFRSEWENLRTISSLVREYHQHVAARDWVKADKTRVWLDTYLPDAVKAVRIAPERKIEMERQERLMQLERHHRDQMQQAEMDRRERERQHMEQMKRQKRQHRELMDQLESQRIDHQRQQFDHQRQW